MAVDELFITSEAPPASSLLVTEAQSEDSALQLTLRPEGLLWGALATHNVLQSVDLKELDAFSGPSSCRWSVHFEFVYMSGSHVLDSEPTPGSNENLLLLSGRA